MRSRYWGSRYHFSVVSTASAGPSVCPAGEPPRRADAELTGLLPA